MADTAYIEHKWTRPYEYHTAVRNVRQTSTPYEMLSNISLL